MLKVLRSAFGLRWKNIISALGLAVLIGLAAMASERGENRRQAVSVMAQYIEHAFYIAYFGYDPVTTDQERMRNADTVAKWAVPVSIFFEASEAPQHLSAGVIYELDSTILDLQNAGVKISRSNPSSANAKIMFVDPGSTKSLEKAKLALSVYASEYGVGTDDVLRQVMRNGCFVGVLGMVSGTITEAVTAIRDGLPESVLAACLKRSILGMLGFSGTSLLEQEESIFNSVDVNKVSFSWLDKEVVRLYSDKRLSAGASVHHDLEIIRSISQELAAHVNEVEAKIERLEPVPRFDGTH